MKKKNVYFEVFLNEIFKILSLTNACGDIGGGDKVFSELSVHSGDQFLIVDATQRTFIESNTLKSSTSVLKQKILDYIGGMDFYNDSWV